VTDLIAARAAIRSIVEPLKLRCYGFHVDEQLGRAKGEDWLDDDVTVFAQTSVSATDEYPIQEYEDYSWKFKAGARTRRDAFRGVLAEVEAKVPTWEKQLDQDLVFATRVGGRVRALKPEMYWRPEGIKVAYETNEDVSAAMRKAEVSIAVGDVFDIVSHKPGKLLVRAPCGDDFWVYRWKFYSCLTTNTPGERIPNPHYEFLEVL